MGGGGGGKYGFGAGYSGGSGGGNMIPGQLWSQWKGPSPHECVQGGGMWAEEELSLRVTNKGGRYPYN